MILEIYGILKDAYDLYIEIKTKISSRVSFAKMYKCTIEDCKKDGVLSKNFINLLESTTKPRIQGIIKNSIDKSEGARELESELRQIILDLNIDLNEKEVSCFFTKLFFYLLQSNEYSQKIIRMRTDIELSETHQLVKLIYSVTKSNDQKFKSAPRILTCYTPKMQESLVGRESDLNNILTILQDQSKIVIVNGMGGIGKTALCRALFYDKNGAPQLAWINYKGHLLSDLVEQFYYPIFSRDCSFDEKLNQLLYFLREEIDENAVLFVDNINVTETEDQNIHILNDFRCKVICTSRINNLGLFKEYDLDFLDEFKCIELFESYYRELTSEQEYNDVMCIIQLAGHHTLTIEAIAKVSLQEGLQPSEILGKLENDGFNLSNAVARITNSDEVTREKTIIDHLKYVFDISLLEKRELDILKVLSILPNLSVPDVAYKWFGLSGQTLFNHLTKYAWLKSIDDGFFMHHVIKEVVKNSCKITLKDCEYTLTYFVEQLQRHEAKSVQEYNDLLPYAEGLLEYFHGSNDKKIGELCFAVGQAYYYTGKLSEALILLKESYRILSGKFTESNTNSFSILSSQATIENRLGNFEEAGRLYSKALEACESSIYKETTIMADIYRDIATNLIDMKKLNLAIYYQEKAVDIYKKNSEFLDLASVYNNIGLTYFYDNNYKKALDYYDMAEKFYQNRISKEHQDYATLYNNRALVLCDEGKLDESLGYHLRALNIRNKFKNENHMDLSESYNNIATVFLRKGDLEKAIEYQSLDIEILEKANPVHPYLIQSYQKIGDYYEKMGNIEEAKIYKEKAENIKKHNT